MSNLSKNYIYNIISLLTGVLFPFVTFPYVSRILMPEYLGRISFVQSFSNYFITLALLGIPSYGIRELSRARVSDKENFFSKTYTELFIISIIGSLISFVFFMIFAVFYSKVSLLKPLMYIYSLQIIFAAFNLDYLFISLEKHKRRTIRTMILRIISLLMMLILIKKPQDYLIYGMILVLPEVLARVIDFYQSRKYLFKNLNELQFKKHIKPLLTIFLYVFSVGIYLNLDATMLGLLKSQEEVGFYSTASKLVRMAIPVISVLGTVMAPKIIGYIKKKETIKIYDIMDKFIDFNMLVGIPATLLMIMLAKDLVTIISGIKYLDSVLTMKIITPIIIFLPVGTFFGGQILLPNDKESLVFKVAVTGMIFNVLFNFLFIPKFGKEGAAFATAFTETLICLYRGYEVKKIYPDYKIITKSRLNYLFISLVSGISLFIFKNHEFSNSFYRVIALSFSFGLSYIILLYIFKDKYIQQGINFIRKRKACRKEILQ